MTTLVTQMNTYIFGILLVIILTILLSLRMEMKLISMTPTVNSVSLCKPFLDQLSGTVRQVNGWRPIGHTYKEQARLHAMSTMIAAWPGTSDDKIPTVPCLSADGHLLVLSVAASRVRYGVGLTFVMVYPTDVTTVFRKVNLSKPLSSYKQNLWCIFDDGSVTPAYSYELRYGSERASFLDCPLSSYASDQLWKYHKTLQVYLASTTNEDRNVPILKAFVTVPKPIVNSRNSTSETLTLCTSPLHNQAKFLTQWIEFHRLVGFRKFVVYNTTDTNNQLASVLKAYTRIDPNLIDVVQWNFSHLGLVDMLSRRYFQMEALHDCLIRYGDQTEWLGMIDLDEYIVPLHPYETVVDYLHDNFGRRIIGSVNLWSQFFCTEIPNKYTSKESDTNRLTIERFNFRALWRYKSGREKYLYRPRFVQYLSIHHQVVGFSKQQSSENHIMLAHYALMNHLRIIPGCASNQYIKDTSIQDRFAARLKNATALVTNKL